VDTFWAEAKQWQAGIAALFGFVGLILAALFNFHLNRRRDARLRREEMMSVAAAVYGEILLLRDELALLARIVAQHYIDERELRDIDQFTYSPSMPLLYPALAGKLGLLPSDLLLGITRFYAHVEGARRGFESCRRAHKENVRYNVRVVLEDAVKGVLDVKPVLRKIEQMASIPEAMNPDTGRSEDIVDHEEWMDKRHEEDLRELQERHRLRSAEAKLVVPR
jgi:hypothetical protein